MKIRLVAIDLDGTLLNSAKRITEATAAVLHTVRRTAGVRVVLATARPPRSVRPFYAMLDLDTPTINYNGALVLDPLDGRVILHRPIPARTTLQIVTLARRAYPQVVVSAEVLDRWYTDAVSQTYLTETALLHQPDVVAPLDQWPPQSVTKLLLLGEPERLAEVAESIRQVFRHQVTLVQTEPTLLQIMHTTCSKAAALRAVAMELGAQREEVMAIGDNANDVGMLQWAGIGVAMANAAPEALAAADYVTDHHNADGVAKAVQEIILAGKVVKKRSRATANE